MDLTPGRKPLRGARPERGRCATTGRVSAPSARAVRLAPGLSVASLALTRPILWSELHLAYVIDIGPDRPHEYGRSDEG